MENCYFYLHNFSEFETILTSVELDKVDKTTFKLSSTEKERIEKILRRAVDREAGKLDDNDVSISEDNPDGRKFLKNTSST